MNIDALYVEILPYSEFLRLNEDNDILGNVVKKGKIMKITTWHEEKFALF